MYVKRHAGAWLLCALVVSVEPAAGQGGQYRGPGDLVLPDPGERLPPSESVFELTYPFTGWAFWWEFNRERFLFPDRPRLPRTIVRERILPVLFEVVDQGYERHTCEELGATLIALARIGMEPERVSSCIPPFLSSPNQTLLENAILALGILGHPPAIEALGKLLEPGNNVRVQAMAAFALGLLASRDGVPRVERNVERIRELLIDGFERTRRERSRDVPVACIIALGLLPPSETQNSVELVEEFLLPVLQDEQTRALVRAHVPTTVMRIARGFDPDSATRAKWIQSFVERIGIPTEDEFVRQSAILALGGMVTPRDACAGDVVGTLLTVAAKGRSLQERFFADIALGQIASPEALAFLRRQVEHGRSSYRPWAALGLAQRRNTREPSIVQAFERTRDPDSKAAFAIAMGLLGDDSLTRGLRTELDSLARLDECIGYLTIALGLLRAREATADLRARIERSRRHPHRLKFFLPALAKIPDEETANALIEGLRHTRIRVEGAALAHALAFLGDDRTIEPLAAIVGEVDVGSDVRSAAIGALGLLGDPAPVPWNAHIAENMNYRACTPTLLGNGMGVLDLL